MGFFGTAQSFAPSCPFFCFPPLPFGLYLYFAPKGAVKYLEASKSLLATIGMQVPQLNTPYPSKLHNPCAHTYTHWLPQQAILVILTGGCPNLKPQAGCLCYPGKCVGACLTHKAHILIDRWNLGSECCQWKAPSFLILFHFLFIKSFIFGVPWFWLFWAVF